MPCVLDSIVYSGGNIKKELSQIVANVMCIRGSDSALSMPSFRTVLHMQSSAKMWGIECGCEAGKLGPGSEFGTNLAM
jgi:hypothetical protein